MEKFENKILEYKNKIADDIDSKKNIRKVTATVLAEINSTVQDSELSYFEFVYEQARFIKKRWWILQGIILLFTAYLIFESSDIVYIQRYLSIGGSVFGMLIIPELWKSINANSLEIESASMYSLRQVYSARVLLFAMADLVLLTIFFIVTGPGMHLLTGLIAINFLIPFNISSCIIFRCLCSRKLNTEYIAVFLSVACSVLWGIILSSNDLYSVISMKIWMGLLFVSFIYLIYCILKSQKMCTEIWEVNRGWN